MAATVEELKKMLQPRGLSTAGRKTDLQDRAKDWITANTKVGNAMTPVTNGSGGHLDDSHGQGEKDQSGHTTDGTGTVDNGSVPPDGSGGGMCFDDLWQVSDTDRARRAIDEKYCLDEEEASLSHELYRIQLEAAQRQQDVESRLRDVRRQREMNAVADGVHTTGRRVMPTMFHQVESGGDKVKQKSTLLNGVDGAMSTSKSASTSDTTQVKQYFAAKDY